MAKHFKPAPESSFNGPDNTIWLAVNPKALNNRDLLERMTLDNLPPDFDSFEVTDANTLHIADLFYKGIERVYIFHKDTVKYHYVQYPYEEEF